MYIITKSFGGRSTAAATITVTLNSINSISPCICMKYNRFILKIDKNGPIDRIKIRKQNGQEVIYNLFSTNSITIDLTDFVDWNNQSYQYLRIFASQDGVFTNEHIQLRFYTILGKSYPFRPHVNEYRQVVEGDNIQDLFVPFDGFLFGNNRQIPLVQGVNEVDTNMVGLDWIITNTPTISTFDSTFDDTFRPSNALEYVVHLEKVCPIKEKYCLIQYLNYLGENCTLLGYCSEIENEFAGTNYKRSDVGIFDKMTKLNIENHEQKLNVVIPNIYYKAYPSDIMLNETVKITVNGTTYECSPIADATNLTEEYQDYEIMFKIV